MKLTERECLMYVLQVCRVIAAHDRLEQPMEAGQIADVMSTDRLFQMQPHPFFHRPVFRPQPPRPHPAVVGRTLWSMFKHHGEVLDGVTLVVRGTGFEIHHQYADHISPKGYPYQAHAYTFAATTEALAEAAAAAEAMFRGGLNIDGSGACNRPAAAHDGAQRQAHSRRDHLPAEGHPQPMCYG